MANKYESNSKAKEKKAALYKEKAKRERAGTKNNEHYVRSSRSVAADEAYSNHKKPYDEWTMKNFRNECMKFMRAEGDYNYDDRTYMDDRLSAIGKYALRRLLLRNAKEKHHVGPFHELVTFYEVDSKKLLDLIEKELAKRDNKNTNATTGLIPKP